MKAKLVAFHVFWRGRRTATSPQFEEVGPTHVFAAASGAVDLSISHCRLVVHAACPEVPAEQRRPPPRDGKPAALAPTMRRNAVMLADRRRVLCRRLVRQTPQKRHRIRLGVYESIEDLKRSILDFIELHNKKEAKLLK